MKRLSMTAAIALLAAGSYGQNTPLTHTKAPSYLAPAAPSTCAVTPNGLVSFYSAEGTTQDLAGTFGGSLVGDVGYGAGMVNQAFSFDGDGDGVHLASAPTATSFTIEAWAYLIGDNLGYASIYVGGQGFWLLDRKLNWWVPIEDVFVGNTQIPPDEWHHLALTYDGDSGTFMGYVDGVNDGTSPYVGASLPAPADLGTNPAQEDLEGLLDELSVYSRVLSESEIQGIFAAGSAGKCLIFKGHSETGDTSRWPITVP